MSDKLYEFASKLFRSIQHREFDAPEPLMGAIFMHADYEILLRRLDISASGTKCNDAAEKYLDKASSSANKNQYNEAIRYVNLSILSAPRCSETYALAFNFRSTVFFKLTSYECCLNDIETIFRSNCPKRTIPWVHLRRIFCYLYLNCYGKAEEGVKQAELMLLELPEFLPCSFVQNFKAQIAEIKSILNNAVKVESSTLDSNIVDNLPKLSGKEHPYLSSVSDALILNNHIFVASRDIKEGEFLVVEEPFHSVSHGGIEEFNYCYNCFKNVVSFIPCTQCTQAVYCSEQCREDSFQLYHHWACRASYSNTLSPQMLLVLRILCQTQFAGHLSNNGIIEELFDFHGNHQTVLRTTIVPESKYHMFAKQAAVLVGYLEVHTDFFEVLRNRLDRPSGTRRDLLIKIGVYVMKCLYIISKHGVLMNGCGVYYRSLLPVAVRPVEACRNGIFLYNNLIRFRMGFKPNVHIRFEDGVLIAQACEQIDAGATMVAAITYERRNDNECSDLRVDVKSEELSAYLDNNYNK